MDRQPSYEELALQVETLKKSLQLKNAILDASVDMIMQYDTDLNIVWANRRAAAVINKRLPDILGRKCHDVFQEKDQPCKGCPCIKALQTGRMEHAVVHQPAMKHLGDTYWENFSIPITDDNGQIIFLTEIARNVTERLHTESALRESEERYRLLSDVTMEGILIHKNGVVRDLNHALTKILGYERDELIGTNILELAVHPDDQDTVRRNIAKHYAHPYTIKSVRKNGDLFFAELEGRDFARKDETLRVAAVRDVSARVQTEAAIVASERKWRNILVNVPQIGLSLDNQGRIVFANKHFLQLTDWRKEDVLGKNWFDMFIPEALRSDVKNVFNAVMRGEGRLDLSTYENEILTRSGERRNVAWSNVLTRDVHGGIVDVTCLGVDLTERKQAETALKASHERFLTVLNSIEATIYAADIQTYEILFMNQYMIDDLGRDMTGEICWKAFRGRSRPCQECTNARLVDENGRPADVYIWQEKKPISNRWFINYDRAVEWVDGRLVRLQIATDITKIKSMEERLRRAQKLESIGNLAGGIAHDFNNLLFPIIGMAELLMEDLAPGSPEYENAQEIFKAGNRGSDLVRQILAFSRQTEHKMLPIRLQPIVKEVFKLLRASIPANIEIEKQIDSDCGRVMADPTQIHQIAMNLMTNAYHALEKSGGTITVQLSETNARGEDMFDNRLEPGRYARLRISDNGCGIDPAIMDLIFEPYFTTKDKGKGTGLGLATAYGITREHKGDIKVYSTPGIGTTFDVYLPLMETPAASEPPEKSAELQRGLERILLVDDEAAVVGIEKQMLERLGYRVAERTSSSDALKAFAAQPAAFDLVISDMTMPNMTGDQLARELIAMRPDIPIIICTGFSEHINQQKATAMGIRGFLMKPIVKSELAKMVRKVLDEK